MDSAKIRTKQTSAMIWWEEPLLIGGCLPGLSATGIWKRYPVKQSVVGL